MILDSFGSPVNKNNIEQFDKLTTFLVESALRAEEEAKIAGTIPSGAPTAEQVAIGLRAVGECCKGLAGEISSLLMSTVLVFYGQSMLQFLRAPSNSIAGESETILVANE
jgi:hypothetical protein